MNHLGISAKAGALSSQAEALLQLLPGSGEPVSNAQLRRSLGLEKDEYYAVRNLLLERGRVTKHSGRGGKTALIVEESDEVEEQLSNPWRYASYAAFGAAAVAGLTAVAYIVWWRESETWIWNMLTLLFGGITLLAVGLALQIYRQQAKAAHEQEQGQALVLKRIEALSQKSFFTTTEAAAHIQKLRKDIGATAHGSPRADDGFSTCDA